MRGFIIGTLATAVAFWLLAVVLPSYTSFDMVTYQGEPIGLVGFVINAGLLLLTAWIADLLNVTLKVGDFPPTLFSVFTFVSAIVGAIILSIISSLIGVFVKD